jgi:hypothetical protein
MILAGCLRRQPMKISANELFELILLSAELRWDYEKP